MSSSTLPASQTIGCLNIVTKPQPATVSLIPVTIVVTSTDITAHPQGPNAVPSPLSPPLNPRTLRPRSTLTAPTAFPVTASPIRNRSKLRTVKGWKDTATVTMPKKVKSGRVTKTASGDRTGDRPVMGYGNWTQEQKIVVSAARKQAKSLGWWDADIDDRGEAVGDEIEKGGEEENAEWVDGLEEE